MELCKEYEIRKSLIVELNGFQHNLYHDSTMYGTTRKVLQEAKQTETEIDVLLFKYQDFFEDSGISVYELFESII